MSRMHMPFSWGVNDCCLFACDVIKAMTGQDLADGIRGTYTDALGAARALKKHGGDVEKVVLRFAPKFGYREIPPRAAQRGDILVFDTEQGPSLGVSIGATAAFTSEKGLIFVPLSKCRRAWKI